MSAYLLRRLTTPLLLCIVLGTDLTAQDTIEGFTEPYRTVDISAGEPGVVTKIAVKAGESVEAGKELVSLDTTVLEATLEMAKEKASGSGSVDAAKAELDLRQARLNQIALLRQRGHATQREYTRAEADVAIAAARYKLSQEEQRLNRLDCKRIEAQIARRRVSSPFSGVIAEVHREVGESLLISDPRIVTLVQLDKLRTRFPATPNQAAALQVDQRVKIKMAESQKEMNATIERISPVVDAKSGTLEVHVVIDNPRQQLRSGIRCLLEVSRESQSSGNSVAAARLRVK